MGFLVQVFRIKVEGSTAVCLFRTSTASITNIITIIISFTCTTLSTISTI